MTAPVFYCGAPPHWLWAGPVDGRLFVSHRALRRYKNFQRAVVPAWALDSGGFTEIQQNGRWTITPREYVQATVRYQAEIGRMIWAAPQDWMCEEAIIEGGTWKGQKFAGTRQFLDPGRKLTYLQMVELHQHLTTENLQELESLWPQYGDGPSPYKPVLQGEPGNPETYLRHEKMYRAAGVRLEHYSPVGIGGCCRIESTPAIRRMALGLAPLGLPFHWYGLKEAGLPEVWPTIASHDSGAWSKTARHAPRSDGCTHVFKRGRYAGRPSSCANCPVAARRFYSRVTAVGAALAASENAFGRQGDLFGDDPLAGAA